MHANVEAFISQARNLNQPAPVIGGGTGTSWLERATPEGFVLIDGIWSATAQMVGPRGLAIMTGVHIDHARGGVRALNANTYRTGEQTFIEAGFTAEEARGATERGVEAVLTAREIVGDPTLVAGCSIGSLDDSYKPTFRFTREQIYRDQYNHIAAAQAAGAELAIIDTLPSLEEIEEALAAANTLGMPAIVNVYGAEDGTILPDRARTPVNEAAYVAQSLGALAFGQNCLSPYKLRNGTRVLLADDRLTIPIAGFPQGYEEGCEENDAVAPDDYPHHVLTIVRASVRSGIRLTGGCCNVGPEDTARIVQITEEEAAFRTLQAA
jgi:homocysteine S-methyltransferase